MSRELNLKGAKDILQCQLERSLGLPGYTSIISKVKPNDPEFQHRFNAFFKVRRDQEWQDGYYAVFAKAKGMKNVSFEYIIKALKEKCNDRCEASFASKMLATLDTSKPILDSNVLAFLGFRLSNSSDPSKRVDEAIKVYGLIEAWYQNFLKSDEGAKCLDLFDKTFPKYTGLNPVKKIDCFLWGSAGDEQTR